MMTLPQPGRFDITIIPEMEFFKREDIAGRVTRFNIPGETTVQISGHPDDLKFKDVLQFDRFAEYELSDLYWAEPAGRAKLWLRNFKPGDRVNLSNFSERAAGVVREMLLTCICPGQILFRDNEAELTVTFTAIFKTPAHFPMTADQEKQRKQWFEGSWNAEPEGSLLPKRLWHP